jgi:hypothetical protein
MSSIFKDLLFFHGHFAHVEDLRDNTASNVVPETCAAGAFQDGTKPKRAHGSDAAGAAAGGCG